MKEFSTSGLETSRVNRRRLKLGTILGSGALTAALFAPAAVQAADLPVAHPVAAPTLSGMSRAPLDLIVRPLAAPAADPAPQDLTMRPLQRLTATIGGGVATYSYGDITTTANNTPGVSATYAGAVTITIGNITTSGTNSPGVNAGSQANPVGQASITTGNITTSGDNSPGISAFAGGNINITAGSVTTSGKSSPGIYAYSAGGAGNVVINVGDVTTGSSNSPGVYAYGHDVSITTGKVTAGAVGIFARGSGAVDVTANGAITAYGRATGIGVYAGNTGSGTVSITTTGEILVASQLGIAGPRGIEARGYGDVSINSQSRIKAYGEEVVGISAYSETGNVKVASDAINIYGKYSTGISVYAAKGAVTVASGDIIMSGNTNVGIAVAAGAPASIYNNYIQQIGSAYITLNGTIDQVSGIGGEGIFAEATGDVAIHNNGSIVLGNEAAFGIEAIALGNIVIDGQGSITTGSFGGGPGIVAISQGGSISITQGAIQSNAYGVLAVAGTAGVAGDATNGIAINVASVTTTGSGKAATGIMAVDYNGASTVTINAGSVTTIGDYANGVTATAFGTPNASGSVTVTGGAISTRGKDALGVAVLSVGYEAVTLNSVATTGLGAAAVDVQANPFAPDGGTINVNVGSISTTGDYALGVFAYHGTQTIQLGSVTTAGKQSLGVYAFGDGDVTINAGTVSTAGDGAIGLFAKSATSVSITETGGITTQGDKASGVIAVAGSGPVDLTLTGAISTKGGQSAGAVAVAGYGPVTVQASTITTAGAGAPALAVYANQGTATVNITSASTSGVVKSPAIIIEGETGATITAGQITTSGAVSNGVNIQSGGYGVIGNATVNVASITTTGEQSAGVGAVVVGQSLTNPSQGSTLTINVGSIATTGLDSPGISAMNGYGAVNINTSSISTQGYESTGVLVFGGSDINIQAGAISTGRADGIYAYGTSAGTISIGVSGKIASTGANGVVAMNAGGATNISVASTGSISGAVDGVQVHTGTGAVTINNAGTIAGGAGYAIDVTAVSQSTPSSNAQVNNTGTLVGAVNLAAGSANLFTNAGVFEATKDSDFGGSAQFVNSGVLKILPGATAPGTVSFLGLASFENAGGLIDLRNGAVGDVFTLSGDYVASGNARLGLDVGAGAADKLVILGTASGATSILLGANPANAALLAKPLTLVQAGAGSTATFTLSNPNIGLVHYGLQTGAGAGGAVDYDLTASAGAPVYGMLKLEQSAQTIWRQSADAWSEHLAAMRGDAWGGGSNPSGRSGRWWVQAYGSTSDRSDTVSAGWGALSVNYNQTDAGVQAGADLVRTATRLGTVGWGVTAGYTASQIDALGGALKSDVETFNFGGYGAFTHGAWFANALVKFDHHQFTTSDSAAGYSTNLNGDSYGAQVETGRRFGTDRFAFEPTASLTYVRTGLDRASMLGQNLAFDDEDGLSGKIGGRILANRTFAGTSLVFYAGAAAVDDFAGQQRATFYSGGTSQNVSAGGEGAYAQALAGVSARTARGVTLYLEGDANFGGDHSGTGVRFGARF